MIKLRAVTLIELMVVMIVSTIVIGVCYFSYLIAHNQLGEYKKINKVVSEAMVLNALLEKDFMKARQIQKNDDGILFTFEKEKQHEYQFGENEVIRKVNMMNDTFKLQPINVSCLFQMEKKEKENELVDELTFQAKVLDKEEFFHFVKQYDAKTLMGYEVVAK